MSRRGVRKFRGKRGYYERLRRKAMDFSLDLGPNHWYDLWHEHFDWYGYSTRSARDRAQHLSALFAAFRRALNQASEVDRPVQIFVSIAPDSEPQQDALYVHTPNPNGTLFPHPFEGVRWRVTPPLFLRPFVEGESWEAGVLTDDAGEWWVVRPPRNDTPASAG